MAGKATVTATCVMMTAVHTPPNRRPPPAVPFLSRAPRPRVTLSAGTTPDDHGAQHREPDGVEHGLQRQVGIEPERQPPRVHPQELPSPSLEPEPRGRQSHRGGHAAEHQRLGEELQR